MNSVVENSDPALLLAGDGGSEQGCAAALTPSSQTFTVTVVLGRSLGFIPLPITSFIQEGCYLAKLKSLSIMALVCVNY